MNYNFSRQAKKNQLRIWKGFTPSVVPEISTKIKNFTGKVMEVGNGDNLVVKTSDGVYQKIFFSSFRAPKYVTCTIIREGRMLVSFDLPRFR